MAPPPRPRHPLIGVPTLLIVDDYAAARADLAIVGMLMHGGAPREAADTLNVPRDRLPARRWAILRRLSRRQTDRSMLAARGAFLMNHQHRSPTR
jgi:hypothetical protein